MVEILLAFLMMAGFLLPVFFSISSSMREVERAVTEINAQSQARFIMDTVLTHLPWRTIRAGNPCRFNDPRNNPSVQDLLRTLVPKMFGTGCETGANTYNGDGMTVDDKGFRYRLRMKCLDVPSMELVVDTQAHGRMHFPLATLIPRDADNQYNVMKKLILEVRWSLLKGKDPLVDPQSKCLHLVAFKADLE